MGAKWLGCCMIAAFPSITKWQPYKFLKQPLLQNGHLGPRVVFSQPPYKTTAAPPTNKNSMHPPKGHTQGAGQSCCGERICTMSSCVRLSEKLEFPCHFFLQMNAHYKMRELPNKPLQNQYSAKIILKLPSKNLSYKMWSLLSCQPSTRAKSLHFDALKQYPAPFTL